jgi:hypothetical protein
MLFRAEGRENMIADRAYSPGSLPFTDPRASLFYFAAALPAVGFVHGSADVNPLNEAMYEEGCLHEPRIGTRYGHLPDRLLA